MPAGLLRGVHDAALLVWMAALLSTQARLLGARRQGIERELALRRRLGPALTFEHAALGAAVLAGLWSMSVHGWRLGYPRWLSVKLGLVAFLVLPLEGMHAWVNHVWIPRALSEASAPATLTRALDRWIGMDDMVRTLAALLLAVALPVIAWLSLARPS